MLRWSKQTWFLFSGNTHSNRIGTNYSNCDKDNEELCNYKLQRQKQQRGKRLWSTHLHWERCAYVGVKGPTSAIKTLIFQFQCAFSDLGRKSRNMVWSFLCVFHLGFLEISIHHSPNHKIQSHTPIKTLVINYNTLQF